MDFGTRIGHEQGGVRPAVVVGSATHCRFPIDMALVVPLTSHDRGLDHHVHISSAASGVARPSWARTEEITAVSTRPFTEAAPMGTASPEEVRELSDWLREMVAFT